MVTETLHVDTILEQITRKALTKTGGNRTAAAKIMGISVRTLRNWINRYDLSIAYPPSNKKEDGSTTSQKA